MNLIEELNKIAAIDPNTARRFTALAEASIGHELAGEKALAAKAADRGAVYAKMLRSQATPAEMKAQRDLAGMIFDSRNKGLGSVKPSRKLLGVIDSIPAESRKPAIGMANAVAGFGDIASSGIVS